MRKGVPEFEGHGTERPATQGRKSGPGDGEEIVVRLSERAGWSIRGQKVTEVRRSKVMEGFVGEKKHFESDSGQNR